jgi:transcriptional regulator with XRE-family HTH domain
LFGDLQTKMSPMTAPSSRVALGRQLRLAREAGGVKLNELARQLGRSVGHLSNVEAGRDGASWDVIALYEERFGTDGHPGLPLEPGCRSSDGEARVPNGHVMDGGFGAPEKRDGSSKVLERSGKKYETQSEVMAHSVCR